MQIETSHPATGYILFPSETGNHSSTGRMVYQTNTFFFFFNYTSKTYFRLRTENPIRCKVTAPGNNFSRRETLLKSFARPPIDSKPNAGGERSFFDVLGGLL